MSDVVNNKLPLKTTVSIRVEPALKNRLVRAAYARKQTPSALAAEILERALAKFSPEPATNRRKK